jgi:MerR family transcriptional regulator, copper efflux regulator
MADELIHIGRVAEIVGLSLRTIRHYEEMGLVTPSGRTAGGFRLYCAEDVDRLFLIKRMKPLGCPLEEMARLLKLVDALTGSGALSPPEAAAELRSYADAVAQRITTMQAQVEYAQEFHERILSELTRHGVDPP